MQGELKVEELQSDHSHLLNIWNLLLQHSISNLKVSKSAKNRSGSIYFSLL